VAVRFIFRRRRLGLCDDVLSIAGNAVLLALWHDPRVMSAIAASGGLDEAFSLLAMLILPGIALGGIGGLVGAGTKRFSRSA
jgi:hypothetical protein